MRKCALVLQPRPTLMVWLLPRGQAELQKRKEVLRSVFLSTSSRLKTITVQGWQKFCR